MTIALLLSSHHSLTSPLSPLPPSLILSLSSSSFPHPLSLLLLPLLLLPSDAGFGKTSQVKNGWDWLTGDKSKSPTISMFIRTSLLWCHYDVIMMSLWCHYEVIESKALTSGQLTALSLHHKWFPTLYVIHTHWSCNSWQFKIVKEKQSGKQRWRRRLVLTESYMMGLHLALPPFSLPSSLHTGDAGGFSERNNRAAVRTKGREPPNIKGAGERATECCPEGKRTVSVALPAGKR